MQFTVSKSALTSALALVGRVVGKASSVPILSNVLHESDDC